MVIFGGVLEEGLRLEVAGSVNEVAQSNGIGEGLNLFNNGGDRLGAGQICHPGSDRGLAVRKSALGCRELFLGPADDDDIDATVDKLCGGGETHARGTADDQSCIASCHC